MHLARILLGLSQGFLAGKKQPCWTLNSTWLIIDTQASLAYPASHKRHILIISISLMGKPVPFALSGKKVPLRYDSGDIDSYWLCQLESKVFPSLLWLLSWYVYSLYSLFAFRHRFCGIALSAGYLFEFFCPQNAFVRIWSLRGLWKIIQQRLPI